MKEPTGWSPSAIATAAILAGAFVAILAVNWPGHLSYDSVVQLLDGRTGRYNTWHPPVMAWLLGLFDAVVPGAGLFVVFDTFLILGALLSLIRLGRVRPWSPLLALAIALTPQVALYQGLVWKDVLFADATVAGFVCLAHAGEWAGRPRTAWLCASALSLTLAVLARQNGLVVLPLAAAALGWSLRGQTARGRAAVTALFALAVLALAGGAGALLNLRGTGDSGPKEQLHVLALYDLAGAVRREPALPMRILADDDPGLEAAIRTRAARLYTPVRNDPIMSDPQVQGAMVAADTDALLAQWRDLILHRTGLYLEVRASDFAWVFLTPDIVAARPVFTGIEGPAPQMARLGLAPRRDARDLALERYAKAFFGTPVWSHAAFALLAVAAAVILLRRRKPADIAIAGMVLGAFAFSASFFVISISCDYRYLYVLDLSTLVALFYLSLDRREAA